MGKVVGEAGGMYFLDGLKALLPESHREEKVEGEASLGWPCVVPRLSSVLYPPGPPRALWTLRAPGTTTLEFRSFVRGAHRLPKFGDSSGKTKLKDVW